MSRSIKCSANLSPGMPSWRRRRMIHQEKRCFSSDVSHELRNPLAAISNGVYLLKAHRGTNAELAPIADMMARQTGHLTRLLDDLLDLARVSRDRISLQ